MRGDDLVAHGGSSATIESIGPKGYYVLPINSYTILRSEHCGCRANVTVDESW